MASAKEECDPASQDKSLACSWNIASVNQFPQQGFMCQGKTVLSHCLGKGYYKKYK